MAMFSLARRRAAAHLRLVAPLQFPSLP